MSFNHFSININSGLYARKLQDQKNCEHFKTKMKIELVRHSLKLLLFFLFILSLGCKTENKQ